MRTRIFQVDAFLLASVAACSGPQPPRPVPCDPRTSLVDQRDSGFTFSGTWNVLVVRGRAKVLGTLHLSLLDTLDPRIRSLAPDIRSGMTRMRYFGTWQGDLRKLGVINPDSPESGDPTRAGARLDQYRPPGWPWVISLGADRNNVRRYVLDGYSFSLRVAHAASRELQGTWSHMVGEMANVGEGTWCAARS
jgi:hypothetical protein